MSTHSFTHSNEHTVAHTAMITVAHTEMYSALLSVDGPRHMRRYHSVYFVLDSHGPYKPLVIRPPGTLLLFHDPVPTKANVITYPASVWLNC